MLSGSNAVDGRKEGSRHGLVHGGAPGSPGRRTPQSARPEVQKRTLAPVIRSFPGLARYDGVRCVAPGPVCAYALRHWCTRTQCGIRRWRNGATRAAVPVMAANGSSVSSVGSASDASDASDVSDVSDVSDGGRAVRRPHHQRSFAPWWRPRGAPLRGPPPAAGKFVDRKSVV